MRHAKVVAVILAMLLVIIVVVQNHDAFSTTVKFRVDFKIFAGEGPEMSLYLVAVIAFVAGLIASGLSGMIERFRLKSQLRTCMRDIGEKEKELNSLRNLPVTTDDMHADGDVGEGLDREDT